MAYKKLKYWFDEELVNQLSEKLQSVDSSFDHKEFKKNAPKGLEKLELKDRVEKIADGFHSSFRGEYQKAVSSLIKILGPENDNETGMFKEYYWIMPIAKYVEKYGLDYFDESMIALKEITKRNTSEYAVRPFIEKHFNKTIKILKQWSVDPNKHVRRLSSEGIRPRLPWAKKLDIFIENPEPIIPILNNLKDDKSKYIQKSVANCINDILKDNFETGKKIIENWSDGEMGKERKWIIKHALRNLLKADNLWAKEIVGIK